MPAPINYQKQIDDLKQTVDDLKKQIVDQANLQKTHQHSGTDGSSQTEGKPDLKVSTISISGGTTFGDEGTTPLSILEAVKGNNDSANAKPKRGMGMQIFVEGEKDSPGELIEGIMSVGKNVISLANTYDFDSLNFGEVSILHYPSDNNTPQFTFFVGVRTPFISSSDPSGFIVNGSVVLTDANLNLTPGTLIGCRLSIFDPSGNILEAWRIVANTSDTITINGGFMSPSGSYKYEVYGPMFLGSADNPWRSLYLDGEFPSNQQYARAIRFGLGPTSVLNGSSIGLQYIGLYYGKGSPLNIVKANIGSIYLRTDGGTSTTLYVKESGNGLSTGWVAK